jgi:2-methylcitrate dehydratase PrpD
VQEIHLRAFSFALKLAGAEEYDVNTRESADLSMPCGLAVGMIESDLGPAQYANKQWNDPRVKAPEVMRSLVQYVEPIRSMACGLHWKH